MLIEGLDPEFVRSNLVRILARLERTMGQLSKMIGGGIAIHEHRSGIRVGHVDSIWEVGILRTWEQEGLYAVFREFQEMGRPVLSNLIAIQKYMGTYLTNLQNLDVLLSTRASELTLSNINSKLDTILSKLDVVKDVTQHLSNTTIAAGGTVNVDIGPITDRTGIMVIVRATYASGATSGIRVRYLYSADGANYDSIEDADAAGNYFEPTFAAGVTRQRSEIIAFISPYIRISITNKDSANTVTVSMWTVMVK